MDTQQYIGSCYWKEIVNFLQKWCVNRIKLVFVADDKTSHESISKLHMLLNNKLALIGSYIRLTRQIYAFCSNTQPFRSITHSTCYTCFTSFYCRLAGHWDQFCCLIHPCLDQSKKTPQMNSVQKTYLKSDHKNTSRENGERKIRKT